MSRYDEGICSKNGHLEYEGRQCSIGPGFCNVYKRTVSYLSIGPMDGEAILRGPKGCMKLKIVR